MAPPCSASATSAPTRQAGDGGQSRPLQALRRHRRLRHRSQRRPRDLHHVVKALEPTSAASTSRTSRRRRLLHRGAPARVDVIPVFHDDQHGTAIIAGAALLNAVEVQEKRLEDIKLVFLGAGAAGISCARLFMLLGVRPENILCRSTRRAAHRGRGRARPLPRQLVRDTDKRTLAEALDGADVLVGLSVGGIVKPEMIARMAPRPIIMALANPDPEILYARRHRRAARRDRRHRPQRLPEPGQQRPRLPVHLPRRARRARDQDQRGR
jgi:hypothetical protein